MDTYQEKKQKLSSYENKIQQGISLNTAELEEFCRLYLEINKISIPNCENSKAESLKTLLNLDKQIFKILCRFSDKYDPFIKIEIQLQGKGQIRDFRTNPNLEGIDPSEILSRNPLELIDLFQAKIYNRELNIEQVYLIIRQLNKSMENRNLNRIIKK